MSNDGYTAADALAALAIVGLAVAGLMSGLRVIGVAQAGVGGVLSQAVAVRSASNELGGLLQKRGPFRSDTAGGFEGDDRTFSFPCDAGRCSAEATTGQLVVRGPSGVRAVALTAAGALKFSYVGSLGPTGRWPPTLLPPPAPSWQVLKTVVLKDQADRTVAMVRIWTEQRADCEFDVVIQDCRRFAP